MRVSPLFNFLAAPFLYRAITIDDSTKWRFAEFPRMPKRLKRLTADKTFNLKYIDEVYFEYAHGTDCVTSLLPDFHTLNISVLSIYRFYDTYGFFMYPIKRCTCTDSIVASKIVYQSQDLTGHIRDMLPSTPQFRTITSIYDPRAPLDKFGIDAMRAHCAYLREIWSLASQLIFIAIAPSGSHDSDDEYFDFLRRPFEAAQKDGSHDYVMVNLQSLLARQENSGNETDRLPAELAEIDVEEAYKLWVDKNIRPTVPMKAWSEIRPGQIRVVSMKTYLREFDWRGEFTEEQVQQWLA